MSLVSCRRTAFTVMALSALAAGCGQQSPAQPDPPSATTTTTTTVTTTTTTPPPSPVATTPPAPPAPPPVTEEMTTAEPPPAAAYYANCAEAKAAGAAPLHRGDPGYRSGLDRDGDGIACEK